MPKKDVAVGTALVVAGAVAGLLVGKSIASNKVIIITDGSIQLQTSPDSHLTKRPSGKKHDWSEKADRVIVHDCNVPSTTRHRFDMVTIGIRDSAAADKLVLLNENNKLAIDPQGDSELRGGGTQYRVHRGSGAEVPGINRVIVTYGGNNTPFPPQGQSWAKTCVSLVN